MTAAGAPPIPTVTVILVAYDGEPGMLEAALASMRAQSLVPSQIICVDQSPDGRFSAALTGDDRVEVVRPEQNLGYPSACNLAAAGARGEFILFLNPDAHAEPSCLEELVRAVGHDPHGRTAIAGAQVLLPGGRQVNAGANVLHLSGLSWSGRYGLAPEAGPPRPVAVVSGAALLVRRRAYVEIGGYTEGFFMYYDDVDLAWRARLAGWEVLFCPAARVEHDYEFSKGDYKWRYLERNRWWCLLAHLQLRTLIALTPLLLAVELAILGRARREGWLSAKLSAYRALWEDRRALMARRRELQRSRVTGDRAILVRMTGEVDSPFLDSPLARRAHQPLEAYRRLVCRIAG